MNSPVSFRFLQLSTIYATFLRDFLKNQVDADSENYETLFESLIKARFAESNFRTRQLRELGVVAETQFLTFELLQKKWAAERKLSYRSMNWFEDIAVAQVEEFQPDVLFLDDLYWVNHHLRERLQKVCRSRPLMVGWRASPTKDYSEFRDLDLILTCAENMVEKFRAAGVNAELLRHGFEPDLYSEVDIPQSRDIPISFAGGLGRTHAQRGPVIETMLHRTPLEVWSADASIRWYDRLRHLLRPVGVPQSAKSRIATLSSRYPGRIHPAVSGLDYYSILSRSKISLNCHHPVSEGFATNMRMFEVTGMGSCLLTDKCHNLQEIFEPDQEVVTYDGPEDCVEKIHYLLNHEKHRQAIAAAGQARTFRDHNYQTRTQRMIEIFQRASVSTSAAA